MKRGTLFVLAVVTACLYPGSSGLADEREPAELDVPYEPTHPEVVDAMLTVAGVCDKDVVYDLGCGDGRIVVRAAKRLGARGVGVDLDPQRVREARENAVQEGVGRLVEFREADLLKTDFRPATVVTLYLLPSVNLMLRPKLMMELEPGTRVVSHAFNMADWQPDQTLEQPRARGQAVYYWVIPAAVGGVWRWSGMGADASRPVAAKLEQCFQRLSGQIAAEGLRPVSVEDAALSGREVTFAARVGDGGDSVKVVFNGRVEGDALTGTQRWGEGADAQERPWTAWRDGVDLAGAWRITDGPEQSKGELRITRENGALAAVLAAADGAEQALPQFYAWGACVRFQVPREGGSVAIYNGFVRGDAAEGTVAGYDSPGQRPWSAKRSPDPPAGKSGASSGRQWTPNLGSPQAGDEYRNRQDGSVLVWIPGGEFTMGRDDGPEDERPAHSVRVGGFWLGKFEITNRQFREYHDQSGGGTPMFWEDSNLNQPEQPVVGLTFSEAQGYCEWAGLRLPTEAEWEYAAGAGRRLAFPTATGELGPGMANVHGVSGEDRWEFTAPVGQLAPNPLGLYDMAGNAWEWTSSRSNAYPYVSGDGREDEIGGLRVMRGGCWAFPADYAATTRRHRFSGYLRYDYVGIRVARSGFDAVSPVSESASAVR